MKRNKHLAILATVILGVAGLAVAQEGYYGQKAANQPAAQTDSGTRAVACACRHMHGDTSAAMRSYASPAAPETSKKKRVLKPAQVRSGGASTQPEGDANAPQNLVEYGGAGF